MKAEKALAIFTDYSIVVYMEVEGIGDRIYIYYVPYTLFPSKENHQLFCVSDTTRKRTDPSATIFLHIFDGFIFLCTFGEHCEYTSLYLVFTLHKKQWIGRPSPLKLAIYLKSDKGE